MVTGLIGLAFGVTRSEAASFSVDDFLKLSAKWTGFPVTQLERAPAKAYLRRLTSAQRELARKLLHGASLPHDPAAQALSTDVIRFWFSEQGFESLAWKSLDFAAPPMVCHGEWWKSPT